ncbi:hypothetical protein BDB00DRAFT_813697 [Zychaea mexicana]|uniref:uncharacterized protein n=1 Tax=Zychaea mexicana TaxID=64656 RepID=UPI0022FEEB97|nr:uncharacterized protein BDB00DRAFT_813697 [Zychaea mexicana]KAI9495534.1 hypothetical protein BDB00DRAFT_813697 [Zychaea mexicana]
MRWIAFVVASILLSLILSGSTRSVVDAQQQPVVQSNQIIANSPNAAPTAAAGINTASSEEAAVIDDGVNNSAPTSADIAAADDDEGSSHSLAVGLPIGTWSILQLNESSRAAACKQQTDFCAVMIFTSFSLFFLSVMRMHVMIVVCQKP